MQRILSFLLIVCLPIAATGQGLPDWEFESHEDLAAWVPNSHLENVRMENGAIEADTVGPDPYFHCRNLLIPATCCQYVLIRIRADRSGIADLFWSGETEGKYGGLTEAKKNSFKIRGDGYWDEIPVFPFWHTEGTIRQLRLDLYEGAHFEIDSVQIREWSIQSSLKESPWFWKFNGDLSTWRIHPNSDLYLAPPLELSTQDRDWATFRLRSQTDGVAAVVWATGSKQGLQSEEFEIRGDNRMRSYLVRLKDLPGWGDLLLAFGLRLPSASPEGFFPESVEVGKEPKGPAELFVSYFGFEDSPNRNGKQCRILARIGNSGAEPAFLDALDLQVPNEVEVLVRPPLVERRRIDFENTVDVSWVVKARDSGGLPVQLSIQGEGGPLSATAVLTFTSSPGLPKAEMAPKPRPIATSLDICAYYFPGWDKPEKWDCIRETAPVRKPMLGYYDEGDPECVDWQIKWAVENCITCFLVDWYWVGGNQQLTHWFEAYRKSRYRDLLQVAIMWANHNPPGTHSREDWKKVTQEWIDRYFSIESYYQLEGQLAVFLWDPRLIRTDLGGSVEVKAAFEDSQRMAQEAGYPGIRFIALHDHDSKPQAERLLSEGYYGATNYHEWGEAPHLGESPNRMEFEDLVLTASETWRKRDQDCGKLLYYPVVDTGWDARPWHGKKARVIRGRTPELFEQLLREGKSYCQEHKKTFLVLGPINEWGEGSYIEPCTEFGFDMYERIREVFAISDPSAWPVNVGPSDVGLGPYDYPSNQ